MIPGITHVVHILLIITLNFVFNFSFLCSNVHAAGGLCISHSCVAMCMQLVDCVFLILV